MAALLVGLRKRYGLVAGLGDIDQRIPVAAARAQEEAPSLVDLGLHSPEHDLKPALSALPHGAPTAASYCGAMTIPRP